MVEGGKLGNTLGVCDGDEDGTLDSLTIGFLLGIALGRELGFKLGFTVGPELGCSLECMEGMAEENSLSLLDGPGDGNELGTPLFMFRDISYLLRFLGAGQVFFCQTTSAAAGAT